MTRSVLPRPTLPRIRTSRAAERISLFAALSTSMLAGCADLNGSDVELDSYDVPASLHQASQLGQAKQAIVGGKVDSTHTAVVSIATLRAQGDSLCSGVLIAPNVVLTAQHCVAPTDEIVDCKNSKFGAPFSPVDIFVSSATQLDGGANFYPVRDVIVPQTNALLCGNDIALLVLARPLSGAIVPMAPRLDEAARGGETYTAVGYGDVEDEGDAGTRRERTGLTVACGVGECNEPAKVNNREFLGGAAACEGDSGGPALDAQDRVIGVLSRGPESCSSSVYSAVEPQSDWIRSVVANAIEIGNYRAPVWFSGATSGAVASSTSTGASSSIASASTTPSHAVVSAVTTESDGIRLGSHAGCSLSLPGSGSREAAILGLLGLGIAASRRRSRSSSTAV